MKITKKYLQNCNMLLITFMIAFIIFGIINLPTTNSVDQIGKLDKKLDSYEVLLKDYEGKLVDIPSESKEYKELYSEYEHVFDEYMKVYEQRKSLYQNQTVKKGFKINSSVLFLGAGLLLIIMIIINVLYKLKAI